MSWRLRLGKAIKKDDESLVDDGANILEVIFHDQPLIHFSLGHSTFFLLLRSRLGFCVKSAVLFDPTGSKNATEAANYIRMP